MASFILRHVTLRFLWASNQPSQLHRLARNFKDWPVKNIDADQTAIIMADMHPCCLNIFLMMWHMYFQSNKFSPFMITFPILGLLGGIFHFYSTFNQIYCKQTVKTQVRRHLVNDLGLHYVPMSR